MRGSMPTRNTPPLGLTGVDHLVLRVVNRERMLAFSCNVLGCTVEREEREIGMTQLRAGRSLIDLVDVESTLGRLGGAAPGAEGHNLDHFCLGVRPFDEPAIRAHLAEHGVEVLRAGMRYGAEGKGPSLYIRDPDGNTVELKGPAV